MISKSFTIIGPFPPPNDGNAVINNAFALFLKNKNIPYFSINTASPLRGRTFLSRFLRIFSVFNAYCKSVFVVPKTNIVYLSISNSYGILYECVFVFFARILGKTIVLHHHSFRHLKKNFFPTCLLTHLAGPNAWHVVLDSSMQFYLRNFYNIKKTWKISNTAFLNFVPPLNKQVFLNNCITIGFISNLSFEKGLNTFMEVARLAHHLNFSWKFLLAGPFQNQACKRFFFKSSKTITNLHYLGALYEQQKKEFFLGLDFFLFPSRLEEAEPVVILEAMQAGVFCIATNVGCVPNLLKKIGKVIGNRQDFALTALREILRYQQDPQLYSSRAVATRKRLQLIQAKSKRSINSFLSFLR